MKILQAEKSFEKLKVRNLKRKIEDNDAGLLYEIVNDYQEAFKCRLSVSPLMWREDQEGTHLYDRSGDRLIIHNNRVALVSPSGKKIQKYKKTWVPNCLPQLPKDALISILKFIPPWELLPLRFVCKLWNETIKNTVAFWRLGGINNFSMKGYIFNMFLGASRTQIVNYLFDYPDFFASVCKLLLGERREKGQSTKYKLIFGDYALYKRTGELRRGNLRIDVQIFMEAYRQKISLF